MPKIREITSIINTALQDGNFSSRKFQSGKWFDIAYILSRVEDDKETKFPAIVGNDGEAVSVSFDDTYPIQFYHRILEQLYEDDQIEDFGDEGNTIKEVNEMVLICMGNKSKLGVFQEEISAAIWADMPRKIKHSVLNTLTLQNVIIEPVAVNNNPNEVFNNEYSNVDYNLAPENFMLAIRYKITVLYSKNCFKLCN